MQVKLLDLIAQYEGIRDEVMKEVEQILLDTMYDLPSMDDVSKVVVDETVVSGDTDPYIIIEGGEHQLAASD